MLKEPFFRPGLNKLASMARASKLVMVANPNNPTGNLVVDGESVRTMLDEAKGLVVVDEAYYEFSGVTVASLVRKYDNLVVLRTFSKAFSLAGLRVGYALASPEVTDALYRARPPFTVTSLSLAAATAALSDLGYVRSCVERIAAERTRLTEEMYMLENVQPFPSEANFILFRSVKGLGEKLAREGILIRDLSDVFSAPFYRVSVGAKQENDAFLEALKKVV